MLRKKRESRYEWVPHELRRDHTESVVAYVMVGLSVAMALAVILVSLATVN